jgi:serine protease Do
MSPSFAGIARTSSNDAFDLSELVRRSVAEVRSGRGASGAGVIWGASGLVITAAHCVPRDIGLAVGRDGAWQPARLVAHDPKLDLAILAMDGLEGEPLDLRGAESLRVGELVFAYGHPLGARDAMAMGTVHGIVQERGTSEPGLVIADVRLAPGNSGGPLVDAEGRLVGINRMVINGLGVAVSANVVERFMTKALGARAA